MKNVTTTGTVKVGRWTYPAEQDAQGTIRNTKRDGTGEWVKADAADFVADEGGTPKPGTKAAKPRSTKTVATPADKAVATDDWHLLRELYQVIFANFAVTADELRVRDITEKRGLELARYLEGTGLVARSLAGESGKEPIWQSWNTYDSHTEDEVLADFDAKVPFDVIVKERKVGGHPVTNNTHKKPGRSTWAVGSTCPQGHKLATAADIYVMPSGRKQCQSCRKGYPSNI
jgi:hypothetical protein